MSDITGLYISLSLMMCNVCSLLKLTHMLDIYHHLVLVQKHVSEA
jgi:hypothetical protein